MPGHQGQCMLSVFIGDAESPRSCEGSFFPLVSSLSFFSLIKCALCYRTKKQGLWLQIVPWVTGVRCEGFIKVTLLFS